MFRFAHSEYLIFLVVLPLLAAAVYFFYRQKKRLLQSFGIPGTISRLVDDESRYKYFFKWGLIILAIGVLIVGYANPQVGTKFEEVTRQGVDLIVAIDVSNSMKAEDIKPNRLESAKQELLQLINNLQGDRIGIIVFAGDAYTQLPLSTDYNAALLMTEIIDVDIVPRPGTAIGSAIALARKSFAKDEGKYKAMIIITDGENHEDDAVKEAKEAAAEHIIVHTIGMGSPEGAPIPIRNQEGQQVGYRQDREGQTVLTKLNEQVLLETAGAAQGQYIRATNAQNDLRAIFSEIEKMEKKEFGTKQFTEYEDRFQYLVGFAILLLLAEVLTSEKKNKFLMRFSLFRSDNHSAR